VRHATELYNDLTNQLQMTDNTTDEEKSDNSANTQSENPADEIVPTNGTETIDPNQETENMEVQKHTHHITHKKKWGEYLLEFSMLFLAVFLGFLAENVREHNMEKDREKEYMVTMVEDLKSDTALLKYAVKYWGGINNDIDSLADAIKPASSQTDMLKAYRHFNNALNYFSFSYNQRTIAQLKNAGGFRLIRNKNVAIKIIAYDQFNNDAITNIASQHNSFFETVTKLKNKVFEQEIINKIYSQYKYGTPPLSANASIESMVNKNGIPMQTEAQLAVMFEFRNALLSYRQDYTNMKWGYNELLKNQQELIKLISDEYHLQ